MSLIAWFIALPVVLKVLAALGLIVALQALLRSLLAAAAIAAVVLGLWCGHSLSASPQSRGLLAIFSASLFSFDNFLFAAAIFLVIALSNQMAELGFMERLVSAVRMRLSRRWTMAALPAIIGWLPMPGGALFSAPMIEKCDPQNLLSGALKSQANYWFRHIWEFWWPLYPGVLLALQITKLEPWELAAAMLPFTFVSLLAGWYFLLRRLPITEEYETPRSEPLWPLLMPIFTIVAIYGVARMGEGWVNRLLGTNALAAQRYLPMLLGVLAGIWLLEHRQPLAWRVWAKIFSAPRTWQLLALVMSVQLFGAVIKEPLPNGNSVALVMQSEIASWRWQINGFELAVPLAAFAALLPFVAGLSTGITVAYVGASFPIVFGMLGENPSALSFYGTLALALPFGYIGMMLSPVHICWVVTNQYFRASPLFSMAGLIKPALAVLVASLAAYWGIGWVAS